MVAALGWIPAIVAGGCSSGGDDAGMLAGVERAERSAAGRQGERGAGPTATPIVVSGQAISWETLTPRLAEAAGAQVVREAVLDALLEREVRTRGLAITPEAINAERVMLAEVLAMDARVTPTQAEELVEALRRDRGLGPKRFGDLLVRNARLRAIVGDSAELTTTERELARRVALGPRVRCRVIVVRDAEEALALRGRIERDAAAGADLAVVFAREARARSVDATAPSGGLLEAVSPSDPLLPPALALELGRLSRLQLSGVIALDGGYALVLVEEAIPPEREIGAGAVDAAERRAWLRKSRGLMEQAARDLMAQHSFTVLDESLRWNQTGR